MNGLKLSAATFIRFAFSDGVCYSKINQFKHIVYFPTDKKADYKKHKFTKTFDCAYVALHGIYFMIQVVNLISNLFMSSLFISIFASFWRERKDLDPLFVLADFRAGRLRAVAELCGGLSKARRRLRPLPQCMHKGGKAVGGEGHTK